jgi:hypothetical protein
MSDQHEAGPKDAVRLILDVMPDGTFYAVGGDREPGPEGSDRKFLGKDRIECRMERLRGGVAGLRIPTMDEGTRQFLDCLHMLDLASAYEIAIRVLPGDHDDKSLLRGEFLPVIQALRVQVDDLRAKQAPTCDTCHSQPASVCTACFASREVELRATIDRLRRIVARLERERAHFVPGAVEPTPESEEERLLDALMRAYAILNLRDPKDPIIPLIERLIPKAKP